VCQPLEEMEEMEVWPLVAILEITGALVAQVLGQALVTLDLTLDLAPVTLDLALVEILVALGQQLMVEILLVEVDHGQTQGLLEAVVGPGVVMVAPHLEDHLPELLL